jgi:hypothetical protein
MVPEQSFLTTAWLAAAALPTMAVRAVRMLNFILKSEEMYFKMRESCR